MVEKLAIVGGTHGNELTGIKLIDYWQSNQTPITRSSFETHTYIGNPLAAQKMVRYIDEDLNRAFSFPLLEHPPAHENSWESRRAHELNQLLGPKMKNPKIDFILDLHTTTADMGITLIVYKKTFNLRMAGYIQSKMDDVHIYSSDKEYVDTIGLQSIAPHGMLVEIGPVAQGLLQHDIYEKMQMVCTHALDYVQKHNTENYSFHGEIEAFQRGTVFYYPADKTNKPTAVIHKDFQKRNYEMLKPGDPIFYTFAGETIHYNGNETGYPVFINEAAYLEKNIAFRLNKKIMIEV